MFLTVVAGYVTIVGNGNSGCGNDRCGGGDGVKRKAMRFDASGLEVKLGAFFEKTRRRRNSPANAVACPLRTCDAG